MICLVSLREAGRIRSPIDEFYLVVYISHTDNEIIVLYEQTIYSSFNTKNNEMFEVLSSSIAGCDRTGDG
jgi:hypothetical protein